MINKQHIKWTFVRFISAVSIVAIIVACLIFGFMFGELFGRSLSKEIDNSPKQQAIRQQWWQKIEPDVVIGAFEYYASTCQILQVNTAVGAASATIIFDIRTSRFTSCQNDPTPLTHDGEYLIFDVCKITFGAGGCGRDRYRSADMINWQEDIGITWIKGEQYEAWRNLGATSSKADSVKKIIE